MGGTVTRLRILAREGLSIRRVRELGEIKLALSNPNRLTVPLEVAEQVIGVLFSGHQPEENPTAVAASNKGWLPRNAFPDAILRDPNWDGVTLVTVDLTVLDDFRDLVDHGMTMPFAVGRSGMTVDNVGFERFAEAVLSVEGRRVGELAAAFWAGGLSWDIARFRISERGIARPVRILGSWEWVKNDIT